MSLDDYRERVEMLARQKRGAPIFSGSMEQSSIMVEAIFAHAKSSVCLLSDNLNARVYGPEEVVEQARLFLGDNAHKLVILLEAENPDSLKGNPFFEQLGRRDNVWIKLVPESVQERYKFHFMVADGESYRFQHDKTEPSGVAAFGDKERGSHLNKIFYVLWDAVDRSQRIRASA